jgi:hypothetical protein
MENLKCKKCEGKLEKIGKVNLHCNDCNIDYSVKSFCCTCGDELEYLVACGAVDFWCNSCNELKGKSSATYRLA